ncbi:hypothetical protein PUNSTDRAFT_98047 [Punctularia strigosozonata HHB-11173 SS5]|uniref:uncharacterized protein n=1 Tax=Punctularia strigosozonata (strain HHB-11173) TaxID=741275 RepID=UPI0004416D73|nr:uncharacterized protein PUNSTDRAFT_98047 [Punctularia strigosozonata HHB-11173 SS5]EIN13022.1 hypothetical protein PUNSTDRAFT_98047 [Punctularia strigosozonata HHB-11173 SS5]
MSLPIKVTRNLRIIALPLTRATRTHGALTYYQFVTPVPAGEANKSPGLIKWASNKAVGVWAGFGKAPEGNWKLKVFRYGERLIDKIDFEELALKSLDVSLAPKLSKFGNSEVQLEKDRPNIPLYYPQASPSPLSHLQSLVEKRAPTHRKGFLTWMLLAPVTAPVALIPVIPNLPFFYCVWRSWSHYRAYKASEYLQSLIEEGVISPEPNPELESIYASHQPLRDADSDASSTPDQVAPQHRDAPTQSNTASEGLLLTREAIPSVLQLFDLPPTSAADIYRAMEQAKVRLGRGT